MTKAQMKVQLLAAVEHGLKLFFHDQVGSAVDFGRIEFRHPTSTVLQLQCKTPEHGLVFFEITVKEAL